jgi:hypothetical protein
LLDQPQALTIIVDQPTRKPSFPCVAADNKSIRNHHVRHIELPNLLPLTCDDKDEDDFNLLG